MGKAVDCGTGIMLIFVSGQSGGMEIGKTKNVVVEKQVARANTSLQSSTIITIPPKKPDYGR